MNFFWSTEFTTNIYQIYQWMWMIETKNNKNFFPFIHLGYLFTQLYSETQQSYVSNWWWYESVFDFLSSSINWIDDGKKKNLLNFFCLKLLNQLVNEMYAMFPNRNLEAIYIFHLLMKKMTNFFFFSQLLFDRWLQAT